jgi:hypothetical protein
MKIHKFKFKALNKLQIPHDISRGKLRRTPAILNVQFKGKWRRIQGNPHFFAASTHITPHGPPKDDLEFEWGSNPSLVRTRSDLETKYLDFAVASDR